MFGQLETVWETSSDQQARLAVLGEKVAALAHDGRNAVNASKMCAQLLKMRIFDDPEILEIVSTIEQAQDDLANLYDELCQFASPSHLKLDRVELSELWRSAWRRLAHEHRKKATLLREDICHDDLLCEVDRNAIVRVLQNVLQNAIQASPPNGRILVRASQTFLDGRPAIQIAVADQGPGMTSEQRELLCSPFYTTKDGGTGLGMAIAERTVHEHGGRIFATDRDGTGAEVNLVLPRADASVSHDPQIATTGERST